MQYLARRLTKKRRVMSSINTGRKTPASMQLRHINVEIMVIVKMMMMAARRMRDIFVWGSGGMQLEVDEGVWGVNDGMVGGSSKVIASETVLRFRSHSCSRPNSATQGINPNSRNRVYYRQQNSSRISHLAPPAPLPLLNVTLHNYSYTSYLLPFMAIHVEKIRMSNKSD